MTPAPSGASPAEVAELKKKLEVANRGLAEAEARATSFATAAKEAAEARDKAQGALAGEKTRANDAEDALLRLRTANENADATMADMAAQVAAADEIRKANRTLEAAAEVHKTGPPGAPVARYICKILNVAS
jgi:hypothetical protein